MSLVARELEANNIATIVIGSARDIVEHCGVPRFLYVDFPLGNPCGAPWDRPMQAQIIGQALDLLENATAVRVTVQSSVIWPGDDKWRAGYNRIGPDNLSALQALGDARRRQQTRNSLEASGQ